MSILPNNTTANSAQTTPTADGRRDGGNISPELVDEVTAKVYALILLDLKIERERSRLALKKSFSSGGW